MRTLEEHKRIFEEVWDRGRYRLGSEGLRLVPTIMEIIPPQEINDYGSGTGRCAAELVRNGYKVNCIDIAENAMEEDAKSMIGRGITFYKGSLSDIPPEFPINEWGVCLDVLMTVPTDMIEDSLRGIRRTALNLIVEVYAWQDRRMGYDMTQTVLTQKLWGRLLQRYWGTVEERKHPHVSERYLYLCKG